jgi:hypothetical protein
MQYYNYIIDRNVYRCNVFKDTCLVAHKRIDWSPCMYCLEIPQTVVAPEQNHLIVEHTINQ